jgi:DNA-binding NarL/FixJ family response regulator
MTKIRVLLADDHPLFREGLAAVLDSQPDFVTVGEARDGHEAVQKARELRPDLILMDVSMPVCDGLEATKRVKQDFPQVTIVMLTVSDDNERLFEAIRNGAQGYILKNVRRDDLLSMLRGAVQGEAAISPVLGGRILEEFRRLDKQAPATAPAEETGLSAREQEVLLLVASGASNKEIAEQLCISIHTVKTHMRKILAKLHLTSRSEVTSYARREGLVPPPGHPLR